MSLLSQINTLSGWANQSRQLLWGLQNDLDDKVISPYDQQRYAGIGGVAVANRTVLYDLIEAMQYFVYGYSSSFNYSYWGSIHIGLYHKEATVTWQAICEAWVKDDFEGRFWTIGIIDRMRQIMWDEPFDLTWAARPEERKIPSE